MVHRGAAEPVGATDIGPGGDPERAGVGVSYLEVTNHVTDILVTLGLQNRIQAAVLTIRGDV